MAEFSLSERIELMVEGELTPGQHRDLVHELEGDPARWREVALAFMEQQKLRTSVRDVLADNRVATTPPKQTHAPSQDQQAGHNSFSIGRIAALAAVFLLVFSLGLSAGRQSTSTFNASLGLTESKPAETTPVLAPRVRDERGIVGYVRWESRIGIRRLPVFDGTASKQWLAENPPQIDERLERMLARSGWQVTPARRLVSMQFDTGDTFTIPIDDLTYQYVGQQVF